MQISLNHSILRLKSLAHTTKRALNFKYLSGINRVARESLTLKERLHFKQLRNLKKILITIKCRWIGTLQVLQFIDGLFELFIFSLSMGSAN